MLNEIRKEIVYIFWLCVILSWGLMFCDIENRFKTWGYQYQSWEYNLNPSEGTGWIDSIVKP